MTELQKLYFIDVQISYYITSQSVILLLFTLSCKFYHDKTVLQNCGVLPIGVASKAKSRLLFYLSRYTQLYVLIIILGEEYECQRTNK